MNAVDSVNRTVVTTVNGYENVNLDNIKCPVCGCKMEITDFEELKHNYRGGLYFETNPLCHGSLHKVYHGKGYSSHSIGMTCPNCESKLTLKGEHTVNDRQVMY